MSRLSRYEGGWDSQMRQMMTKSSTGKSGTVRMEIATVKSPLPDLKIERDSDQLPLYKEDIVVAEYVHLNNLMTQDARLLLLCDDVNMVFYVLDRAVWY